MDSPISALLSYLPTLDFIGIIACVLIILIMLFRRGYRLKGGSWLLFSFVLMLYALFIIYLFDSGKITKYPHFFGTGAPVFLLYVPTMYLYMQMLANERNLRWMDGLHLLPALLFLVDFIPFYQLSAQAKQAIILGNDFKKQFAQFDQGWLLPTFWHNYIRNGQSFFYWLLEVQLIHNLIRARKNDVLTRNRAWFNWMLNLVALQLLLFVPAIGGPFFGWNSVTTHFWYDLGLTMMALLTCFTLLLRPEILYGLQNTVVSGSDTPASSNGQPDDKGDLTEKLEHYIPPSLILAYDRQIREFMQEQEAFLKPGYTIREMAEDTGITLHHLSAVINRHYGYHFNDYINQWRINHLKQRLDKKEWKQKTLEALAQESGFTNRTSFISAFKKHCGTTPSNYVRSLKNTV